MTDRITMRDLEALVRIINKRSGIDPDTPLWTKGEDGRNRATIGMYCLDGAYGGWSLEQIMSEGGGVHDTLRCGHTTKRDLYNRLRAFLDGMDASEQVEA